MTEKLTKTEAQQKKNKESKEEEAAEQDFPENSKRAKSRKWSKVTGEFMRRAEEIKPQEEMKRSARVLEMSDEPKLEAEVSRDLENKKRQARREDTSS